MNRICQWMGCAVAMMAAAGCSSEVAEGDGDGASVVSHADALCIRGNCVTTMTVTLAGALHHTALYGTESAVHYLTAANQPSVYLVNSGLLPSDRDVATVNDLRVAVNSALPLCTSNLCTPDPRTGEVTIDVTLSCKFGTVIGFTPPLDGACDIKSWHVYRAGVLVRGNIIPG
jgi:hypothetical protein